MSKCFEKDLSGDVGVLIPGQVLEGQIAVSKPGEMTQGGDLDACVFVVGHWWTGRGPRQTWGTTVTI